MLRRGAQRAKIVCFKGVFFIIFDVFYMDRRKPDRHARLRVARSGVNARTFASLSTVSTRADERRCAVRQGALVLLIYTLDMPERKQIASALHKGFAYLETHITGTCEPFYDCSDM
mgnify:FL=1